MRKRGGRSQRITWFIGACLAFLPRFCGASHKKFASIRALGKMRLTKEAPAAYLHADCLGLVPHRLSSLLLAMLMMLFYMSMRALASLLAKQCSLFCVSFSLTGDDMKRRLSLDNIILCSSFRLPLLHVITTLRKLCCFVPMIASAFLVFEAKLQGIFLYTLFIESYLACSWYSYSFRLFTSVILCNLHFLLFKNTWTFFAHPIWSFQQISIIISFTSITK